VRLTSVGGSWDVKMFVVWKTAGSDCFEGLRLSARIILKEMSQVICFRVVKLLYLIRD